MIYMFKAMHYCLHIYLKIYRIKCIEIYELNPDHFFHVTGLAWHACVKKTGVELESLTNNDMLLMIESQIKGGICDAIYRYAKVNKRYMKNYNKNIELSSLIHLSNLHGWSMFQKLPVNGFKWKKMHLNLMKSS